MKARHGFVLVGLVGLALGLFFWSRGQGREAEAQRAELASEKAEPEREAAPLEQPELVAPTQDEAAVRAAVTVEVEPTEEAAIDVEVVSKDTGEPLGGIRLILVPLENLSGWSSAHVEHSTARLHEAPVTDERGRATFLVPGEIEYALSTAKSSGAEASRREITTPAAGERLALRIELRTLADRTYFGRVVDAETGEPLAGATARFDDGREGRAAADAEGLFQLEVNSWEKAGIRVENEGYAWTVVEAKQEHATPEKAATIRLSRGATLLVRVERVDGPVLGLGVVVHTDGFWMRPRSTTFAFMSIADPEWRAEVDASGTSILAGLPPDVPLTVDVHEDQLRIKRVAELKLAPGEERELVIRIGSGCRIEGLALEADGTPAAGLEIWLLAAEGPFHARDGRYFDSYESSSVAGEVQVDAAGRFVFADVAPGTWCVGPAPGNDDVAPVARVIEIAADELVKEVSLEIHRGLTISGRVEGPDGEGVPYAYVRDRMGAADFNSRDGNFTLGPLAPGEYELIASPGGQGDFAGSEPVTARAGDQDVVLRFRRGGTISVVVLGPDGESVAVEGELIPEDAQAAGFMRKSTSQQRDGILAFNALLPGIYHVKAVDALGNVGFLGNLTVRAGEAAIERTLTLTAGARVLVRIDGAESEEVLMHRIRQDGVPMGFRDFDAPVVVAPGPLTVELLELDPEAKDWIVLETREVTAIADEEVEVVFDRTEQR